MRRQAAWENALWRTMPLVLLILPVAQVAGPARPEESHRGEAAPMAVMKGEKFTDAGVKVPAAVPT